MMPSKPAQKCCQCGDVTVDWYFYCGNWHCARDYENAVRRDNRLHDPESAKQTHDEIVTGNLFWWDENSNGRLMDHCRLIIHRATGSLRKRLKTEVDYWRMKAREAEDDGCYEASDECRRALWAVVSRHYSGPPKE